MTGGSWPDRAGRLGRRGLAGAASAALVLAGTGAWGWWSDRGSGHGDGGTGAAVTVALTPGTPATAVLPGGQAAVASTATNATGADVRLRSLALDTDRGAGGFAVDAGHAGCATSSLSFTSQDNGGAGWTVPAGGSVTLQLPAALGMAVDAADACQGATFTVYLKAGP